MASFRTREVGAVMPTLTHAGADWIKSAIKWFVVRESSIPPK